MKRRAFLSAVAVGGLAGCSQLTGGLGNECYTIESGSMEPSLPINSEVCIQHRDSYQPSDNLGAGVIPASRAGEIEYERYGGLGDIIVYMPDGNENRTEIIHRAMFWAEAGENWCEHEAADPRFLGDIENTDCVATHSGFITKGDNNPVYDQAGVALTAPVRPDWIVGIVIDVTKPDDNDQ